MGRFFMIMVDLLFLTFFFVYSDRVLLSIVKTVVVFFPVHVRLLFTPGVDSIVPLIRVWGLAVFFLFPSIFRWVTARIMYIPTTFAILLSFTTLIAASLSIYFSSFISVHISNGFLDS